jgi:PAS domain S-box-containing protein
MAVEQSAECIVVTDAAGTIQYVNPTFERVTGYTRAEAIGENPRLLKSGKQEAAFYRAMWDRLSRGESWTGTFVNRRKDGRLYEEQAVISPVKNAEGRTTHYVAVKRDVTHEREMEVQLQQAQRMEAIGRLAGGIAHDFNNLLFLILGSAKLLQEERPGLDPQARDLLDEIQNAGTRAAELTEQLLAFSRKQPRQPKVFDLNDSLTGLRKMLTRALGEKVRLATAFTAAPAQVHFDPGQLEQVVLNLALNARDAMPDGGTLTIETANVDGGNGEDGGRAGRPLQGPAVLLTVRDTGLGMESDTLAHLFEPFYTTKGRGKGTGLGLAIVYGIVEQNGGAIWVQSVPGQGTTFRICLPLAGPDSAAEGTPAAHPAARGGTETILVVEDEAPVRQLATRMLRRLGYTVLEAGSGPEALAFVAQHRGTIELLLTDVIMPEMNGPEVARRLTASHPETRVLYMSGYLGDELSGKADLDPQTTLLRKPFTPGDLAQRIRQMLES